MKITKRFLTALLAALLTLSLAACDKDDDNLDIPANQTGSGDFQKNMHQSTANNLRYVCETEEGIYFQWDSYAYYLEKETKRATILCNKPECAHNDRPAMRGSTRLAFAFMTEGCTLRTATGSRKTAIPWITVTASIV